MKTLAHGMALIETDTVGDGSSPEPTGEDVPPSGVSGGF